jgi:hypothetical protein
MLLFACPQQLSSTVVVLLRLNFGDKQKSSIAFNFFYTSPNARCLMPDAPFIGCDVFYNLQRI